MGFPTRESHCLTIPSADGDFWILIAFRGETGSPRNGLVRSVPGNCARSMSRHPVAGWYSSAMVSAAIIATRRSTGVRACSGYLPELVVHGGSKLLQLLVRQTIR